MAEDLKAQNKLEMGSNLSSLTSVHGLEDFKRKLAAMHKEVDSSILTRGLLAGAEVYRHAIESAVRAVSTRAKVIIAERKQRGLQKEADRSFMIGIDKKTGYYLFWKERGHKAGKSGRPGAQAAAPFFESAVSSAHSRALQVAETVIQRAIAAIMG